MKKLQKPKVYLVGAGPGDPALITVRGAELLRSADCIICDKLVNPALLQYAPPDAEIIHVPKRKGAGSFTQQQINRLLLEKASENKTIVRLKGGDPCVFGRGYQEAALLAEAGLDFEIVPGITAGIAAAAYSGILLTDRSYSSQVVFVTGREAQDKKVSSIDWYWLAQFAGTMVFYMPVKNLEAITSELLSNGLQPDTPAAVVANAACPTQKIVNAPVEKIAEKCRDKNIQPPAILIIGPAAAERENFNWFMKKSLFGKNIVITRDVRGNNEFTAKLFAEAANPVVYPAIKIKPLTRTNHFLRALTEIKQYDWIIFTSPNGVRLFFDGLCRLKKDARIFAAAKVAAVGTETAGVLAEFGIKADFIPATFTTERLAAELIETYNLSSKKILLLRSQVASETLTKLLGQADAVVTNVDVYTLEAEKNEAEKLIEQIKQNQIHYITFASPKSVEYFFAQIPVGLVEKCDAKIACIGPVTASALEKLAVKPDLTAKTHTIDGLLQTIKDAEL